MHLALPDFQAMSLLILEMLEILKFANVRNVLTFKRRTVLDLNWPVWPLGMVLSRGPPQLMRFAASTKLTGNYSSFFGHSKISSLIIYSNSFEMKLK